MPWSPTFTPHYVTKIWAPRVGALFRGMPENPNLDASYTCITTVFVSGQRQGSVSITTLSASCDRDVAVAAWNANKSQACPVNKQFAAWLRNFNPFWSALVKLCRLWERETQLWCEAILFYHGSVLRGGGSPVEGGHVHTHLHKSDCNTSHEWNATLFTGHTHPYAITNTDIGRKLFIWVEPSSWRLVDETSWIRPILLWAFASLP